MQNNQHMDGLLLLRPHTGRWLPGQPPNNGNLGPKAERGAVWELEPAASRGMQCQRGKHTGETNWLSPQIPPASLALPSSLFPLVPAPKSRAGQLLQKEQQLPKCLPRSSSASPTAGGLIPRLESNQSLTQGRESPFI